MLITAQQHRLRFEYAKTMHVSCTSMHSCQILLLRNFQSFLLSILDVLHSCLMGVLEALLFAYEACISNTGAVFCL